MIHHASEGCAALQPRHTGPVASNAVVPADEVSRATGPTVTRHLCDLRPPSAPFPNLEPAERDRTDARLAQIHTPAPAATGSNR